MKKIMTYLLLSLFLALGTGEAFADHHKGHDRDRHEQRYDRRHDKKHDKGPKYKDHDKGKKGHGPAPRHYAPAPRHAPVHSHYAPRPRHYAPAPPPRLGHMVRYATRGCRDVKVWQVDAYTYIVRYNRGGRYYTQYLYPYADRYGACNSISVNWQPLSPWNLIPSVSLNLNL